MTYEDILFHKIKYDLKGLGRLNKDLIAKFFQAQSIINRSYGQLFCIRLIFVLCNIFVKGYLNFVEVILIYILFLHL